MISQNTIDEQFIFFVIVPWSSFRCTCRINFMPTECGDLAPEDEEVDSSTLECKLAVQGYDYHHIAKKLTIETPLNLNECLELFTNESFIRSYRTPLGINSNFPQSLFELVAGLRATATFIRDCWGPQHSS